MTPRARYRTRLGGAALALALCALPVHGNDTAPPDAVVHALTAIDAPPTRDELATVLGPTDQLGQLRAYALDDSLDFGMRLRAIRAIPQFCENDRALCRESLHAVVQDTESATGMPGQRVLRLRAAIEALGVVRTGEPDDRLLLESYLSHDSRDVRFSAARALRNLCDPASEPALRAHAEPVRQVQIAIDEALRALEHCGP